MAKKRTSEEVVKEIISLNPLTAYHVISQRKNPCILSIIPPEKLKLPNGWNYNVQNGITRKHHAKSGIYQKIDVIQRKK